MNYLLGAIFLITAVGLWQLGRSFDQWLIARLKYFSHGPLRQKSQELYLLQACIGELRSGQSLDQACTRLAKTSYCPPWFKAALPSLLCPNTKTNTRSLLLTLLSENLRSGGPSLEALQILRQQTQAELKDLRKRDAIKTQVLVQALVVSTLPWIFVLIPNGGAHRCHWSTLEYALALLSAILSALGFFWLRRLGQSLDNPKSTHSRLLEMQLLPCLLQIQVLLRSGMDLEQALQVSLQEHPELRAVWQKSKMPLPELHFMKDLVQRNTENGGTVSAELRSLTEDIQSQADMRRERELQLLPLRSLVPLFVCSFPAALVSLAVFVLHNIRTFTE